MTDIVKIILNKKFSNKEIKNDKNLKKDDTFVILGNVYKISSK
jgi:hypothetical protein